MTLVRFHYPHHHGYGALLFILIAFAFNLGRGSTAFTFLRSQRCRSFKIGSLNSSDNDSAIFFDDFGDGSNFNEDSSSKSSGKKMSSLLSRMSEVKSSEAAYDAKLARNWRRGNWSVRGFALDKSSTSSMQPSSLTKDMTDTPVYVSVVAAPTTTQCTDSFSTAHGDYTVAVGRTDGSVFIIRVGDEYLTNFATTPKLVTDNDGGGESDTTELKMTASIEKEWTKSDRSDTENSLKLSPFEIKHQFNASQQREAIDKLVYIESIEDKEYDSIVCAASGAEGEISIWKLRSSNDDNASYQVESSMLPAVHSDKIVSLQVMSLPLPHEDSDTQSILFSACRDGTFALWNLDRNGELIISCQIQDSVRDSREITCADVFNPSSWEDDSSHNDNDALFIGTSNGYVIGYRLLDLFANTNDGTCLYPKPNICFRAHGQDGGKSESVTAIKCGGDGTIVTSARLRARDDSYGDDDDKEKNPRLASFILLTGGEDGEILSQNSLSGVRMEHWPRLSTQRMKRRAHLFTPSHDGPVTCIAQQSRHDPSKFITCGQDGSVCVWSASSGKELFRMDGFSSVSSLACLGRELLVTDGMNEYVCVHDFGISEDAASNGYDLDW